MSTMHPAADCAQCVGGRDAGWWQTRPDGARLVGLVVPREGMPSVAQQREDLARFGVRIDGFRHPAPDVMQTWEERLQQLFAQLGAGDVVVVVSVHALGRDAAEEVRTLAELTRRGIVVKVLSPAHPHLHDA